MPALVRVSHLVVGAALLAAACGGDDGNGPTPPPGTEVVAKATASGDGQAGAVGETLADLLRVLVTEDGAPKADVAVAWTTSSGSVAPASPTTGADGIASATWTLGAAAGDQTARATVTGASGSPVTFTGVAGIATTGVSVGNNFFEPEAIVVASGATVTWTWQSTGSVVHNVKPEGQPSFTASGDQVGNGATHSATFATAGVYRYTCTIHPEMDGTVIVR